MIGTSQCVNLDTVGSGRCAGRLRRASAMAGLLAGLALCSTPVRGAVLDSVQTGTATMSAGSGGAETVNVSITSVDMTRSILFFNYQGDSDEPGDGQIRGQLTSSTNIRFYRADDTSLTNLTIRWYVAEFADGVSVQRGTFASVDTTGNVSISSVDTSQSFVMISGSVESTDVTYSSDDFFRARLTSSTNLEIIHNTTASKTADWQVIEFTGAKVQRGIGTMSGTSTSATESITSVDTATSIVLLSWKTDNAGTGRNFLRARFTSPTQITINRQANTSTTLDYAWEVVEFTDGTTVTSGDRAFGTGDRTLTESISVDTARAVALLSTAGGRWGGSHAYTASERIGPGMFTTTITDASTLTLTRNLTGSVVATASWFVAEFFAGGVVITETGGSTDVTEGAATDTYTVVLHSAPTDTVTVTVDPDGQTDLGAGAGVAIELTFETDDWDEPQTVVVTAVDDAAAEGDHLSVITHTVSSSDSDYDGIVVDDVVANITDNETPGVSVVETGGSTDVTEGGATDTYTIVLDSAPSDTVTITVDPDTQTDVGAGTGAQIVLIFTTGDWNLPQTVTVTAVDDGAPEGAHTSTITHSASSSDTDYDGIAITNVVANITEFYADWRIDDGSGATVTDCGSGGNDGTVMPSEATGPQWTTQGQVCNALDFDGSNDYVNVPADASLNPSGDVTITGWFKPDADFDSSTATTQIILEKFQDNDDDMVVALVGTDYNRAEVADGSLLFKIEETGEGLAYTWTNQTSWAGGLWYHFAAILDVSNNANNEVYINGVEDTGGQVLSGTTASMGYNADVNIGGGSADSGQLSGARYFAGLIDHVRFFSGILTVEGIADAAAEANYAVTDLGTVTFQPSIATGINSGEQVAGFDEHAGTGVESAWRWSGGALTALGTLGGATSTATNIDGAGRVVGRSETAGGAQHAFRWVSGSGMTDLGTLAGRTDSEAFAINNNGEIVGAALDFGPPATSREAFLYLPAPAYGLPTGMNGLGAIAGDQSVAMDINDAGEVVGGSEVAGSYIRPFLWLPSAAYGLSAGMNDLGDLGGDSGSIVHRAQGINSSGEVVGLSFTAGGDGHAFLWLPSDAYGLSSGMNDLGVLSGGDTSWAFAISDSGVVVGTSNTSGGTYHAFVWENDTLTDLHDLISQDSTWVLTRALDINSDGYIVGWGENPSGNTRAFLLEPATCGCPASAARSSPVVTLAYASGSAAANGILPAAVLENTDQVFAEVEVTEATPGATFECRITGTRPESTAPPGPDPGTWAGFSGGVAFGRTLHVDGETPPGRAQLLITMIFTAEELAALGVDPTELELHVLDRTMGSPPGVWVPAGKNLGRARPTGDSGDSGFVQSANETVTFWSITTASGSFAVGVRDPAPDPEPPDEPSDKPSTRPFPSFCAAGMLQAFVVGLAGLIAMKRCRRRFSWP